MDQQEMYKKLEKDFSKQPDQWNFENSPYERERFQKLLALAEKVPHASILEIGCAEGHFTQLLTTISKDILAIDVTPIAIQRAKERVKGVTFAVSTLETFTPDKTYDLIVCSEVLYYILDKKKALDKIQRMGRYLLVSNYLFFPFSITAIIVEVCLLRFRRITWNLHASLKERKFCSIGIWKLSN